MITSEATMMNKAEQQITELNDIDAPHFETLNRAYNSVFQLGRLTVGLVVPIENYAQSAVPDMSDHIKRVTLAEQLGFSSLWLRDIPFNVPSFGDAGQLFDPFVYLGFLSAHTSDIALGVSSIILPLRHPAQVAKAAASADQLSNGRLLLGVASGDRPREYPAMNLNYEDRGESFRDSIDYIRAMQNDQPAFENRYGSINGELNMLPKASSSRLPLLITGGSQQTPEWIAENGDGWMLYPRDVSTQKHIIDDWRERTAKAQRRPQPVMQPLYFDLTEHKNTQPQPIHLGFRSGTEYLVEYLKSLEQIGVNHVALNLRFNKTDINTTLEHIAQHVLPKFNS